MWRVMLITYRCRPNSTCREVSVGAGSCRAGDVPSIHGCVRASTAGTTGRPERPVGGTAVTAICKKGVTSILSFSRCRAPTRRGKMEDSAGRPSARLAAPSSRFRPMAVRADATPSLLPCRRRRRSSSRPDSSAPGRGASRSGSSQDRRDGLEPGALTRLGTRCVGLAGICRRRVVPCAGACAEDVVGLDHRCGRAAVVDRGVV
jgi:hypothetical protein